MRRGRDRIDLAGRRSRSLRRRLSDVLIASGVHRLHDPAESSRGAARACSTARALPRQLHDAALVAIDKLDKVGADGVMAELVRRGVGEDAAARGACRVCVRRVGQTTRPSTRGWQLLVAGYGSGVAGLQNLRQILSNSTVTSAGRHIRLDPGLARGLSYYTGAIFEVAVLDLAGSLGGGGRYDNLVGMFSAQSVPACGFSLGLERILVVMGERGMFPPEVARVRARRPRHALERPDTGESLPWRGTSGPPACVSRSHPEADKIGKQLKYASARGARFVTIVGDDEREKRRGQRQAPERRASSRPSPQPNWPAGFAPGC